MRKYLGAMLALPMLILFGYAGFNKYIYWPIHEKGFSSGVGVGVVMHGCGVQPSEALNKYLSHFVEGDIATHNCELLKQEKSSHREPLTDQKLNEAVQ